MNRIGTDHAWGGNHFIMGGDVTGGQMFGSFPDDISLRNRLDVSALLLVASLLCPRLC